VNIVRPLIDETNSSTAPPFTAEEIMRRGGGRGAIIQILRERREARENR